MSRERVRLLMSLLGSVPRVMVCVKDGRGLYVEVNAAFAERFAGGSARDFVGRSAADFFDIDLALSYDAQDRSLLQTARPIRNQLEIISNVDGSRTWYLTSKVLDDVDAANPWIVAVTLEAHLPRSKDAGHGVIAAVELVRADFASKLQVDDLARAARMTADQLERAMRGLLGVSPKEYIMRTRVEEAARLLSTSSLTLAEIALQCGYYDQSQLTRQFKASVGQTPSAYRSTAWLR